MFLPKLVERPELWPSREHIQSHLQNFVRDRHVPTRPSTGKIRSNSRPHTAGPRSKALKKRMQQQTQHQNLKDVDRPDWQKVPPTLRKDG